MLDTKRTLPGGAMTASDAERLRAHPDVAMVVRLDAPEKMERQGGAHRALLLVDGTLLAVTRTDGEWTQEVRSENADRVDLLDAVMAHVSGQREA